MLIDIFMGFNLDAIQRRYSTNEWILGNFFIYQFSAANAWTDKIVLSEKVLSCLTGLSKTTLDDAKHKLTS